MFGMDIRADDWLTTIDHYRQVAEAIAGLVIAVVALFVFGLYQQGRHVEALNVEIAGRRHADTALQQLNRTLRTLGAAGTAVVHAATEKELLSEMCRVAVEIGGYSLAWIGFVEHDEAKTVRPVAWAGERPEYVSTANVTWADDARGQGPTGTAVRTGEVQVNQNVATNPVMAPWIAEMLRNDLKSSIALPLKN